MRNRKGWELGAAELAECEACYRKETSGVKVGNAVAGSFKDRVNKLVSELNREKGRLTQKGQFYMFQHNEGLIQKLENDGVYSSPEASRFMDAKRLHEQLKKDFDGSYKTHEKHFDINMR